MTTRKYLLIGLSLACASFAPGTASASLITVNNQSFEILPDGGLPIPYPGGGHFSEGPIPGWTNTQTDGATGQYQPGAIPGAEYNYLPDGITFAYSNGGTISQTVGATVNAGDVYTLSVDIGNRADLPGGLGTVDLLVDGVQYAATGTQAASGGWSVYTAIYTGLSADAGDSITIELHGSSGQGDFDNVVLDDSPGPGSPTPEPGTAGVLGAGLGSLMRVVRRRRAKKTNRHRTLRFPAKSLTTQRDIQFRK